MPNQNVVTASNTVIITVPVGTIVSFAGNTAPPGWLLCDGATISSSTYPALYGIVGANVPDLRSRFIVGAGQGNSLSNRTLNSVGGEESHTLSENEMPNHSHAYGVGGGNRGNNNGGGNSEGWSTNNYSFTTWTARTGGNVAHNNMPPFYALTYIIKY